MTARSRWHALVGVLALALLGSIRGTLARAADEPPATTEKKSAATAEKPESLLSQAIEATKASRLPKAVHLLDALLKVDPTNREGLVLLARIKLEQAMELDRPDSSPLFLQAAEVARKILALPKQPTKHEQTMLSSIFYYEASTRAVDRKPDKAMAALREAYRLGFANVDSMDTDEDLEPLRSLPEFQALRAQVEQRAIPIAQQHATELLASGKPFPFAFELPTVDQKRVALADFKGKVTVVDIWGTWCPPCLREVPHFIGLYERYHDKGLEIVGINYEREENDEKARETVRDFVKKNRVPYPCVLGDEKTEKQIPDFQGYPTTLFVGRDGTVRLKLLGYHPKVELEAIVVRLLNEPSEKER